MEATLLFFKTNGKYYAEEKYTGFSNDDLAYKVVESIKEAYAGRFNGMNMVILFSEDYTHGYPFMIPADEREVKQSICWEVLDNLRDNLGNSTCWVAEVNSDEYGKFIWIVKNSEDSYVVQCRKFLGDLVYYEDMYVHKTLKDAQNWVEHYVIV